MRSIALLLILVLSLTGCESFFGKSEGKRGALPGKREDVFVTTNDIKIDAEEKAQVVDVGASLPKADWAQPGGSDTRLLGMVALADRPSEVWSASIGAGASDDAPLMASPVVAGDKIYTVDTQGQVSAFDTKNGNRVWRTTIPDPQPDDGVVAGVGLAYANGRLVVSTYYGNVVALDGATGKTIWQKTLPAPMGSAPFISEDQVYVTARTNTLYQLALSDGAAGWTHSGLQESASFDGLASPLVAEDVVVVPYSSGELFGLSKLNGHLLWEENLANNSTSGALPAMSDIVGQLVLDRNLVYAISHSGRCVAIDIHGGRTVWESDIGGLSTPWVAGNSVFVVTSDAKVVALARDNGRARWAVDLPRYPDLEDKTETIKWVGPVLAGGKLWVASSQGEVRGLNPQDGKTLTTISVGDAVYVSPIVAGNTLYVLTDGGRLIAYR